MRKFRNYSLLAGAMLTFTFTSCSNDEIENLAEPVAAQFSANISDVLETRASGTSWDKGDAIGITASGNDGMAAYTNMKYTTTNADGNFTGTTIFFQNTGNVTFSAYYPFTGTEKTPAGTINNNTKATNQTGDAQKNIDYLYATAKDKSYSSNTVAFQFAHKMSEITLTFKAGKDIALNDITGYTISGLKMTGTFDAATGVAATATDASAEDLTMSVSNLTGTEAAVAPVILYPQAATNVKLSIELDGQKYGCDLTVADSELKAGNNYTFAITINKTGLTVNKAEISQWNPITGTDGEATIQ